MANGGGLANDVITPNTTVVPATNIAVHQNYAGCPS